MDTSDPAITFDENGFCNHCNEYFTKAPLHVFHGTDGEKRLQDIIETIKEDGKRKKYDCIIGLSGGVDSSYIAYRVKQLGLRPLAVHFDSGWNSELAVKNIENIVRKLEIDLYTFVCDWTEMRDLQLSYFKAGVINADIPMDHAFMVVLFRTARKYGLKHFISGHNYETEAILPAAWVYNARDAKNLRDIQRRFGTIKLKKYPVGSLMETLYNKFIYKVNQVNLLDYGVYDKKNAIEILMKELNWRHYGGKHHESIFTRYYQGYYLIKRFNVDKRRAHLSTLICSNQISREDALEELKKSPYENEELLKQDMQYIPKKLGVSRQDFERIISQPIKNHTDYKTDIPYKSIFFKVADIFGLRG